MGRSGGGVDDDVTLVDPRSGQARSAGESPSMSGRTGCPIPFHRTRAAELPHGHGRTPQYRDCAGVKRGVIRCLIHCAGVTSARITVLRYVALPSDAPVGMLLPSIVDLVGRGAVATDEGRQ